MVVTVQGIVMLFGALTAVVGVVLLFLRREGGRNTISSSNFSVPPMH